MPTEKRLKKYLRVLEKRQSDLTIVLENISDPHNLSACLRTCDAVGINDVFILYHSGQTKPKLGHASSASAKKWLNYHYFESVDDCFQVLKKRGMTILSTSINEKSESLYDINLTKPVALTFGNEHKGVSGEATEKADANFIIPQVGMIESLNISVACAVSLYEAFRQRNNKGLYSSPQLDKKSFNKQLNKWSDS